MHTAHRIIWRILEQGNGSKTVSLVEHYSTTYLKIHTLFFDQSFVTNPSKSSFSVSEQASLEQLGIFAIKHARFPLVIVLVSLVVGRLFSNDAAFAKAQTTVKTDTVP